MSKGSGSLISQIASNARGSHLLKLFKQLLYGELPSSRVVQVPTSATPLAQTGTLNNQKIKKHRNAITSTSPYDYVLVDNIEKLTEITAHLKTERVLSVDCEGTDLSR